MSKPAFRTFLSHRYKSPEVNQRFFDILAASGDIQFEVDAGTNATNVTRLERFVRGTDAFVGIYPFPSDADNRPSLNTARHASRYFRLELDLAIRSRRPAIVFIDSRYGSAIAVPQSVRQYRFDHRELAGAAARRHQAQLRDLASAFCDEVTSTMRFRTSQEVPLSPDRVGVLVTRGKQYSKRQMTQIHEHLTRMALTPVDLDWKAALDGRFLGELETLDWAVVDIGSDACATGLPAFLHGRFIPQMRLIAGPPDVRSPLENTLLAAFDVGYPKDIVRWHNSKSLDRELVQRLTTLYEPPKYVGTSAQAREYFAGASLRKEAVFLSYSGDDREFAARLSQALRKRFQQVFDYRDQGHSIVPGRRWIEEIFDKLAASGIGVPLLSSTYFKSGNCTHEARQMMSLADAGELTLIPTKMQEGALDLPSWMQDLQYVRGWEYPSPETLAEKILAAYDAKAPRTRPRGSAEPSNRSRSR